MPPQFFGHIANQGFGLEIIYSFVIIVASLMIYKSTKEIYLLTNHRGIKYFRMSFLFFAISYIIRSIVKTFFVLFEIKKNMAIFYTLNNITLSIFMYFSIMAVFYLLYSVISKRFNGNKTLISVLHIIALLIAFVTIVSKERMIIFAVNILILIIISIVFYIAHKDRNKKKSNNLYVIYSLLFVFYILNIIDTMIPMFFFGFQLLIYLASLAIFLMILYKVLKKSGSD